MVLSDTDIQSAVKRGDIIIRGFDPKRLQPASYDLLLGNKFIFNNDYLTDFIDPGKKVYAKPRTVELKDSEKLILHPGVSVLGISHDYFGSHRYLIQLSGKSSLARIGLIVHNTAGIVNPGHFLNITLELYNLNSVPIILRPKMPIAQIIFSQLSSPPSQSYREIGRYNNGGLHSWVPPKVKKKKRKKSR